MKKDKIIITILKEISAGLYLPGEAFESVRGLASKYAISHMTAHGIICELIDMGILESKFKAKSTITKDRKLLEAFVIEYTSLPTKINKKQLLSYLLGVETNSEITNFGTAINMEEIVPKNYLINGDGLKKNYFSRYSYPPGGLEARSHLAKRLSTKNLKIAAQDIILTNGALEGISLCLNLLLSPGDKVLICTPAFYGTIHLLNQLKNKVVEIKHLKKFPLNEIEASLKNDKKIKVGLFQSNYSHPTGKSISENEKKKLVEIFKKYSRVIIEDDTYQFLGYEKQTSTNLAVYDLTNEVVFTCSSFSKVLGPGTHFGWIVSPEHFVEKIISYKISYSFSTQLLNEKLVDSFMKNENQFNRHLDKIRKMFETNSIYIYDYLLKNLNCSCLVIKPEGAFSIWIELPKKVDSFLIYEELIKLKISITPGDVYSLNDSYKNFIRINSARTITDNTELALKKICDVINHYIEK